MQVKEQMVGQQPKDNSYSSSDDGIRTPPPMEIVTNSSSSHPDFEGWKRDMARTLMAGTVPTASTKFLKHNPDWKSARLNKRRLEKKLLHQQLRSVKSDASFSTESVSSEEDQSSVDAAFDVFHKSKRRTTSGHAIRTVYVPSPPESPPLSPRSAAFQRPILSAVEPTLSPSQPNSDELAEIMVELSNLKTWAEGGALDTANFRKSKKESLPLKEKLPIPQEYRKLPTSIVVPQIAPAPKSFAVPELIDLPMVQKPSEKEYKTTIEKKIGDEGNGIPTMLTISKQAEKALSASLDKPKTKKKRVRFRKNLVTDTFYRPWTKEEDIDDLYFQEDELLTWERDEKTTVLDRFEVVVTDFGDDANDQTFSGKLSIGTPVISFHNSYSYDIHESSDEEL